MDRFEQFNEEPGATGQMAVEFDIATGEIRACNSGFWSVRQATAYFKNWKNIVQQIHGAGRSVSALVDVREGAVQAAEVSDIILNIGSSLYRDGDAVAMLVPNSLAKLQLRRILDPKIHDFFVSPHAAETWLKARYSAAPVAIHGHRKTGILSAPSASWSQSLTS